MGMECRGRWAWVSRVWFCEGYPIHNIAMFIFIPVLFSICVFTEESTVMASDVTLFGGSERDSINHMPARRKLDDITGSISIDCGIPEDADYHDDQTDIHYTSDANFIDSGINKIISSKFNSETLQKSLMNVRSFPQGKRNCYTLRHPEGKNTIYLIRASFMYGNYDELDQAPEFNLYIGVNIWDSVKFDNASHIVMKEILHVPSTDYIYVCLLNTGSGTPFISALELRHFVNSSYTSESGSLALYRRFDLGSTTNQIIRFKDDVYDRIWLPYNLSHCISISTTLPIDSVGETEYKMPSAVMRTAVMPQNESQSLDFEFDIGDPTLEFYVYLHFAELEKLQPNQSREFSVTLNGSPFRKNIVPDYLSSTTIYSTQPVRGSKLSFSIYKTMNSTLPPILNALEIYIVKEILQAPTNQEDVNAIMEIKSRYGVEKSWEGDPCAPIYSWDGLNCSSNGYDPPRIISLNLSSWGLTGKISPSLSNLKSLQSLDLSNNSLTGPLPDFLSQLQFLRVLNVTGNQLSGSVPPGLMARSKDGSLTSLRVEKNPHLCLSDPCKKEKKNFVVPLVAAIVSSLVVLIALAILWYIKRKRAIDTVVKPHKEGGSLKSNNRQFTYSEIVSITNNFHKIIGRGGFGTVYHGYLNDGTQVAVKMLSSSSTQGSQQFRTEAQLLMRVHHRNLASLVGYCNEGTNIGLVYEFMANGNLQEHLSDKKTKALSWKERLQIAVDAAHGLEYMHSGCKPAIIHRDVKTANILLNEKLQGKIADFGFSKFFSIESETHLSTAVVGTPGYLDPEYYTSNRLNEKSDVYSFGIVLLELITGQPAIIKSQENTHITQWVSPILARGDVRSIVDQRLEGDFDTNSVWKAVETAMACVPSISLQRPTMSHVLMELKECLEIETARDQTWRREGQVMKSSNSFEATHMDLETEMGPQAR